MSARKIGYAANALVLVASGTYVFVYLYRWEWNRALMAGVLFIAAEVALAAALILDRLRTLETRAPGPREAARTTRPPTADRAHTTPRTTEADRAHALAEPQVLARIEQTAPPPRDHFQWLTRDAGRLNVFVPVLMGAGVVLSGIAWSVERLAHATARPALERGLAARLASLSLPPGGLIGAEEDHLSILLGPRIPHR